MKGKIILTVALAILFACSIIHAQIPIYNNFSDKVVTDKPKYDYTDQTYVYDDFEDGWYWTAWDTQSSNGRDYWDIHDGTYYGKSAWCAENNDGGVVYGDHYDNYMDSYMKRTFDFSGYSTMTLEFDYLVECENNYDYFKLLVNGTQKFYESGGHPNYWYNETINLDSYAGQSSVEIKFIFYSNYSNNQYMGAFVDHFLLHGDLIPEPELSRYPSSLTYDDLDINQNYTYYDVFRLWNSGGGSFNWSVTDNRSWLSESPTSGSNSGENDYIDVYIDTDGLNYNFNDTGTITINASSGSWSDTKTISVNINTISPPDGNVNVTCKYPDGSLYTPTKYKVWDNDYSDLTVVDNPSNPHTFYNLDGNETYHFEAYEDEMFMGTIDATVSPGQTIYETLWTNYQSSIIVRALYNDGVIPLPGATVKILNWEGIVVREVITDGNGYTIQLYVWDSITNTSIDFFYDIKIYYSGNLVYDYPGNYEIDGNQNVTEPCTTNVELQGQIEVSVQYPSSQDPVIPDELWLFSGDWQYLLYTGYPSTSVYLFPDYYTSGDYHVQAMQDGINLGHVDVNLDEILEQVILTTSHQSDIQFEVYCIDGLTTLSGADVIIKNQDGVEIRQGITDEFGIAYFGPYDRTWLWDTTIPSGFEYYYKIEVSYNNQVEYSNDNYEVIGGQSIVENIITSVFLSPVQTRSNGICVYPEYIDNVLSNTDIENMLDDFLLHDIDIIYITVFQTVNIGQGDLICNDQPGTWNPVCGEVLGRYSFSHLAEQARIRDIQVVPIIKCFFHNDNITVLPSSEIHRTFLLNQILPYFLESFNSNGNPYYAFDGIALDYIRYFLNTGIPANASIVTNFVDDVAGLCVGIPLNVFLKVDACEGGHLCTHPLAPTPYDYAIYFFGQDWVALSSLATSLNPMSYVDQEVYGENLVTGFTRVNEAVNTIRAYTGNSVKIQYGVHTYNDDINNSHASLSTIQTSLCAGSDAESNGFFTFRYYNDLVNQPAWMDALSDYSTNGPDYPLVNFSLNIEQSPVEGIRVTADASLSSDNQTPVGNLEFRFMWSNGNGTWEPWTAWSSSSIGFRDYPEQTTAQIVVQVKDEDDLTDIERMQFIAEILSPFIVLIPTNIDLGIQPSGETFSENFIVKNTGSGLLTGNISYDHIPWITTLSPTSFEDLEHNEQVTISFSGNFPSDPGEFGDYINITSNGGNEDVYVHGIVEGVINIYVKASYIINDIETEVGTYEFESQEPIVNLHFGQSNEGIVMPKSNTVFYNSRTFQFKNVIYNNGFLVGELETDTFIISDYNNFDATFKLEILNQDNNPDDNILIQDAEVWIADFEYGVDNYNFSNWEGTFWDAGNIIRLGGRLLDPTQYRIFPQEFLNLIRNMAMTSHCAGMSSTSILYKYHPDWIPNNQINTYQLDSLDTQVIENIKFAFGKVMFSFYADAFWRAHRPFGPSLQEISAQELDNIKIKLSDNKLLNAGYTKPGDNNHCTTLHTMIKLETDTPLKYTYRLYDYNNDYLISNKFSPDQRNNFIEENGIIQLMTSNKTITFHEPDFELDKDSMKNFHKKENSIYDSLMTMALDSLIIKGLNLFVYMENDSSYVNSNFVANITIDNGLIESYDLGSYKVFYIDNDVEPNINIEAINEGSFSLMGVNTSSNTKDEIAQFTFENITFPSDSSTAEIPSAFSPGDQICQIDFDGDGEVDIEITNSYNGNVPPSENFPPYVYNEIPILVFAPNIWSTDLTLLEYINDESTNTLIYSLEYDTLLFDINIENHILSVDLLEAFESLSVINLTVSDNEYSIQIPIFAQYDSIAYGLVAYYPFNGNADDESGNGNDGTQYGGVDFTTLDRFGNPSSAAFFDGSDDYIETSFEPIYYQGDPLTISMWIKCTSNDGTERIIGLEIPGAQELCFVRLATDNTVRLDFRDDGHQGINCQASSNVEDNNWHHIVTLRDIDDDVFRIYIDGIPAEDTVSDVTTTAMNATATRWLCIGANNYYGAGIVDNYMGAIDEIRFYDYALTETEIDSLYHEGEWPSITADFTASDTTGIAPLTVHFADLSSSDYPIVSWQWDFGDGIDTTYTIYQPTIEHTYQLAGTYDVSLIVSDGIISDTLIQYDYITISPDGPDWTVNPALYEYNGNITAAVFLEGVQVSNPGDSIAAFCSGECRGVAGNMEFPSGSGEYIYSLIVYSNVTSGDILTFKYWNSETGTINYIIDPIYYVITPLEFIPDMVYGTPFDPYQLNIVELLDYGIIEGNVTLVGGTGNIEDVEVTANYEKLYPDGLTVNPYVNGDYYMIIATGTYDVTASLTGYTSQTSNVTVLEVQATTGINFTLECCIPESPTNLNAAVSGNDIILSWTESVNANIYYIYRSTNPYSGFTQIGISLTTSYTDNGAANVSKYFYFITAATSHFEWCDVPVGQYTYGEYDEILTIDYDYQIMKYEVTNQQYVDYLEEAYAAGDITVSTSTVQGYYPGDEHYPAGNYDFYDLGTPSSYNYARISWDGDSFVINVPSGYISGDFDNHPVVEVTWFGAWAFAEHYGLDLPTQHEWEKAARGDTGYDYPWGNSIDGSRANYWNSGDPFDNGTTPVGYYNGETHSGFQTTDSPSPYGVYDMAGNICDWTDSWWSDTTSCRVVRGGSWSCVTSVLRSWYRFLEGLYPDYSYYYMGFRCCRTQ